MISKWRNRIIIYVVLTIFVAFIGYYFYLNIMKTNNDMENFKRGEVMMAELSQNPGTVYTDSGKHRYNFTLTVDGNQITGVTMSYFSKEEIEAMDNKVEVYVLRGQETRVYEKKYVDNFVPWVPAQSIMLWIIGGLTFLIALYYATRILINIIVLKVGEVSIGRFEEAFHSKMGSNKYYKVKISFLRDGKEVTAVSPAYYTGTEVDKLKAYGSFNVRYKGKITVIDQRL